MALSNMEIQTEVGVIRGKFCGKKIRAFTEGSSSDPYTEIESSGGDFHNLLQIPSRKGLVVDSFYTLTELLGRCADATVSEIFIGSTGEINFYLEDKTLLSFALMKEETKEEETKEEETKEEETAETPDKGFVSTIVVFATSEQDARNRAILELDNSDYEVLDVVHIILSPLTNDDDFAHTVNNMFSKCHGKSPLTTYHAYEFNTIVSRLARYFSECGHTRPLLTDAEFLDNVKKFSSEYSNSDITIEVNDHTDRLKDLYILTYANRPEDDE